MNPSIFVDANKCPGNADLAKALGKALELWNSIAAEVAAQYPKAKTEWKFPGAKYGWSFRIKDSRRVIVYLIPRFGEFELAFVFGEKAVARVLASDVSDKIKTELSAAKAYVEGRGIRIAVRSQAVLKDVARLIAIKLAN